MRGTRTNLIIPQNLVATSGTFGNATNRDGNLYIGADVAATFYIDSATSSSNSFVIFRRSRGTQASRTIVQNNDVLGAVQFYGYNGSSYDLGAYIQGVVNAAPGASNDMPGRIDIYTSADASATPSLCAQFDSNQDLLLSGNLKLSTVAKGLYLKTGTNATYAVLTLSSGGTALFYSNKHTATTSTFVSSRVRAGTPGFLTVGTLSGGAVQIVSSSTTDTSQVTVWIIEQA